MYLHIFTLNYSNGRVKVYHKFCKHYKKTKLYKQCRKMLQDDILKAYQINFNN
jgi:hypothetical protein